MMNKKKSHILRPALIGILAAVLVAGSGIGTAWAYFTSYASAAGGTTLHLGDETELDEKVVGNKKTLKVSLTSGEPVFIRAKAFSGDDLTVVPASESSGKWVLGPDDYYYYTEALAPEGTDYSKAVTEELVFEISKSQTIDPNAEPVDIPQVNVIVVYESTRAPYNEAGDAFVSWSAVDWDEKVLVRKTEGGN